MPAPEEISFNTLHAQILRSSGQSALENGEVFQRGRIMENSLVYFSSDGREVILEIDHASELGKGQCSRVVKGCLFYSDGKQEDVAVKIAASLDETKGEIEAAERAGLLKYHATIEEGHREVYLVMDRFDGSLEDLIASPDLSPGLNELFSSLPSLHDPLSDFRAWRSDPVFLIAVIEKSFEALHRLHDQGILHSDINPGNICLKFREGGEFEVFFVDYGFSSCVAVEHLDQQVQKIASVSHCS